MQLEMLEMELIKKLQHTQAIQKSAYSELENALQKPSAVVGSSLKKNQLMSNGQPWRFSGNGGMNANGGMDN
jgi:hypothetical protein